MAKDRMVFVNIETTAGTRQRWSASKWLMAGLVVAFWAGAPAVQGQATSGQSPAQSPSQSSGPGQAPQTQPAQGSEVPDAPSAVQPPADNPEPPPIPKPEAKKPVERDPWTNQPISKPATGQPEAPTGDASDTSAPPPMPPVKTLPPGTSSKTGQNTPDDLYKLVVHTNFVQIPVTVKDRNGRMVDGLRDTDFSVKENGTLQKLSYFTTAPAGLSVAIVLDLGMSDSEVQKVNQTFPALVGAFAPYDEVALYTYSSTVSEVSDFAGVTRKLTALLDQMKTERGHNNGPAILNGPLAPNGPIINGVPVGSPTEPVYTPPKESHVLNDAILRAAIDLRKRDRTRRKIIFVISDGREYGSRASYKDVRRVLLTNEIQIQAVSVGGSALPVYDKIERLRLPRQGYDDILPKYASATGGSEHKELTRSSIEDIYAQVMSEARNQYTLGYVASQLKTPTSDPCRDVEVLVHRPDLKVTAKQGYCPVVSASR
jgi:VWFA-related protein